MKKFTKLFLSCAAVTAVTAAVASSAMAADTVSFSGVKYDAGADNDTVTITVPAALASDASKTLLILEKGVTLQTAAASPSTTTILQVQQYDGALTDADEAIEGTQIKVPIAKKNAESADDQGTYKVYMGGTSGTVYEGSFRLGGVEANYGDVNADNKINYKDGIMCLQAEVKKIELTDEQFAAANVVDVEQNKVNYKDAIDILKYEVKKASNTDTLRKAAGLPALSN